MSNKMLIDLLYDCIRDEGQRVVSQELATVAQVQSLVDMPIKRAINEAMSKEEGNSVGLITALSEAYSAISKIKLPGDFPDVPSDVLAMYEEVQKSQAEAEVESVTEALDSGHVTTREIKAGDKPARKENERISKALSLVLSRLEQVAYSLGKSGNHSAAYKVERKMQEIARLAASDDLLISEGQYEKANS